MLWGKFIITLYIMEKNPHNSVNIGKASNMDSVSGEENKYIINPD